MSRRSTGFPPKVRRMILERAGIEGDNVRCEFDGQWCYIAAIHVHHRIPRGSGSTRRPEVNQAANGIVLCPDHHEWCETHRREAKQRGLLISKLSGEMPSQVEVELFYGRVLLDSAGGYTTVGEAA